MGVFEVLAVVSVRTARGILLQAIDDRLRNGRLVCRQVRGDLGIRSVEEQEIYEVDGGCRLHWRPRDSRQLARAARRVDLPTGKLRLPVLRLELLRFGFA